MLDVFHCGDARNMSRRNFAFSRRNTKRSEIYCNNSMDRYVVPVFENNRIQFIKKCSKNKKKAITFCIFKICVYQYLFQSITVMRENISELRIIETHVAENGCLKIDT